MDSSDIDLDRYYILNNGAKMPKVGLGTYGMNDEDEIYQAIAELGYRHIDTGSMYNNEEAIGNALVKVFNNTSITRDDLFITTKLWGDEKEDVEGAVKKSLAKLQIDYLDLYLVHWPVAFKVDENGKPVPVKIPNHKTWKDMEDILQKGYTKSIGVSNFNVQSLIDLFAYCEVKPVCNQIEIHPYLAQDKLVQFMKENDIVPVAFCPLIRAGQEERNAPKGVFEQPIIIELSEKYERTPGQIILNWGIQRGHAVTLYIKIYFETTNGCIPKSSKIDRLKENLNCTNFKLNDEDVKKLTNLNCNWRCCPSEKYAHVFHYDIFS